MTVGNRVLRSVLGVGLAASVALASNVSSVALAAPPTAQRPDVQDDELLVKFRPGAAGADQADAHQQAGGDVDREVHGLDVKVVKVPHGLAQRILQVYQRHPSVE